MGITVGEEATEEKTMTADRVDFSKYIVISVCFTCNNRCTICMLSDLKEKLPGIGFENFKKVVSEIRNKRLYENLILSGAEVTTFDDLDRYIQFAVSLRWFKKIQIQTNGRKLNDRHYLKHLIDQGINEFFVSIHGLEQVHDSITRRQGSFRETMEGLHNLENFDVNVITNTVLTKTNIHDIADLFSILSRKKIHEIHMWNYFPMGKKDTKDFVVSMKDFLDLLPRLLPIVKQAGKPLVLKSFPECLSMGPPGFFDSQFPETLLPGSFWTEFSECGFGYCVYRDRCRANACWGLSSAYVQKYSDERKRLKPFP
jgi:MoaA/NifB/PqqE/SkfB family radical SAM enzyme